jgi:serine/threonine protein kinase
MASFSLLTPESLENNIISKDSQELLGLTIISNCNNELGYIPQPPACEKPEVCKKILCEPLEETGIKLDKINDIQDPKLLGRGGMNKVYDISYDNELPLALRLTTTGTKDIKEKESVGLLYQTKLSKTIEEGGLGCEYIAKVYDFGQYNGSFKNHRQGVYGILEKLPMDLFYRATEVPGNVFTEDDIKSMTKQMLEALSCMHKNHIYHFDIKPENIMMCDEGNKNIKLIDFGLCYTYDEQSEMPVSARGSPSYFSPGFNFRYHNKIDRRPYPIDDLWALAVTICLITGINIVQDSDITIPIKNNKNEIVEESKNIVKSSYILKFSEYFYNQSVKDGYIEVGNVKYSKECIQFLRRIFDTVDSKTNKPTETFTTLSADELLQDPWIKEVKGGKSKRKRKRKNKRKTKRGKSKRKRKN